jgi:hypothetical protein
MFRGYTKTFTQQALKLSILSFLSLEQRSHHTSDHLYTLHSSPIGLLHTMYKWTIYIQCLWKYRFLKVVISLHLLKHVWVIQSSSLPTRRSIFLIRLLPSITVSTLLLILILIRVLVLLVTTPLLLLLVGTVLVLLWLLLHKVVRLVNWLCTQMTGIGLLDLDRILHVRIKIRIKWRRNVGFNLVLILVIICLYITIK